MHFQFVKTMHFTLQYRLYNLQQHTSSVRSKHIHVFTHPVCIKTLHYVLVKQTRLALVDYYTGCE